MNWNLTDKYRKRHDAITNAQTISERADEMSAAESAVRHGNGWMNFVEMNSRTASNLGIRDGEMVWVESSVGRVEVRARVIEGIHPQVVSIAIGQGHYADGRWQQGIGVNPNEIIGVDYDRLSGQSSFFNTRVKVYRA